MDGPKAGYGPKVKGNKPGTGEEVSSLNYYGEEKSPKRARTPKEAAVFKKGRNS